MISRKGLPALLAVALCALGVSAATASSALAAPEFKPATAQKFTDTSGESKLESTSHTTITCTASTSVGEITGAKTVGGVVVKFTGCKQGTPNCQSTGAATGEIITNTLTGSLTGTEAAPTETLSGPENAEKHKEFVKFKCGTVAVAVTGEVTGVVKPIKTLSTEGELIFTKAGGLTAFEEAATLTSTDKIKFEKAVEVT
jgi:outer membrane lipoprotein SlyB